MTKDLNLLRLLIVLNEERQTILAAKRMNLSQPTISVMLKKLRDQFNDPLFVRDRNQLEPTVKCRQLLQQVPVLLEQLDALYVDKDNWDISKVNGEINLLFSPPLMSVLAAPIVSKLTELAPNVTVQCYQWGYNAIADLEAKKASWGIGYLPIETNKNIIQKDIGSDQMILIMRKGHPLSSNILEEILQYPLCINIVPGVSEPSRTEMLIKKYNLNKHVNVRTSDISMMLHLLNESNYIGVVSKHNYPFLNQHYRFEYMPELIKADTASRPLALFTHQRNRNEPLTKWLHDEAKKIMSSMPEPAY
ncbi:LysR family transcriptional regulator [Photobacterium sp. SDRW27]|uniref:LysR family transcriptional regulator n=1 Tax=Photobacterium obscurum TaxID=2829490 RepID=UPI002244C696|nr:LysR family transcriptional regulator [Photobacterium obscurum]MCW8327446.1 LysR family transcriptional regulator [Photobacterium obscurum]